MPDRVYPRKSFHGSRDKNSSDPGANIDKHYDIYNLVDMHGGGELIPWMRYALNSGDYSLIDGYMETKVRSMMYNGGKGKLESVAELVKRRNKERNERLSAFSRKKGKGKSGPNILDDFNQESNKGDLKKALKLLDGGKGGKGELKYREVVWKLDERGQMGENLVGICLMLGGAMHNKLAMRMLEQYPKLVNDIFLSEDYYGLSPLHQAIVNEDPWMVNYLLQNGADINQRCYGAHFCPDDQRGSRTDSLEHEYVELSENTNYYGKLYFGEFPIAFAACTNQPDCYRILRANRADPNAQDTNGNAVLHMTVIHENLDMFRLAYETGARLQVMNNQNLTPLTLAAKLAKKRMFEQILKLESDVIWQYGDAASTAFPLAKIDTINQETGELNEDSALSLIVYGETNEHLDLLDGLVEELLQAKWKAFGRRRWIVSLSAFTFYYMCFFIAFMCRPFSIERTLIANEALEANGGFYSNGTNGTIEYYSTSLAKLMSRVGLPESVNNFFAFEKRECPLWNYTNFGYQGYLRLIAELLVVFMALFQIVTELLDIRSIGKKRWWQVLSSFPAKVLYKISLLIVLCIVPIRLGCGVQGFITVDNTLSLIAVLMTTVHFLYYCRAIKFVGPFVLMVYMIITRDIIRFFVIYFIFVMGFSQGFYIIFLACQRADLDDFARMQAHYKAQGNYTALDELKERENIMANPVDSMMRLFISTIGEFTVMYRELNGCAVTEMVVLGKVLFVIFEISVSLMQFNLLIATMTRTYEVIYRTQKEWKRQWAQVILMLELSLQPKDRLMALLKYSRPIGTDKRRRAFVVSRKIDAMTETERSIREQQENDKIKEKKQVLKRRLRNMGTAASRMKNGQAKTAKVGMTQPAGSNDKHYAIYNLVDMHGGGELIPWMRYALNSGDYSLIDGYMETKVRSMMYNGGKGKLESVAELVKRRNKERNERLGAFSRKKGKGKSGPNILDDFNQEANQGDLKKALKLLDGGKGGKGDAKYREVVWKLEERGSMGEGLIGCCLMQGGPLHNKLAVRMLEQYPKLVNDIFLSEDYYGLSPLHQAIVNEDPWMVTYLLQNGADINQRCYGAHFCPDDQVSSRTDSLEHEYVELGLNTNYTGKMYFGEFPLAFAACTNQEDCYRILRAKKADPNCQDTNGNTVLHMTVIHENLTMFRLAYATGARLQVMNKQNLTPLTLAAKLAKRRMFEQILQLESSAIWHYGDASSTAFPLAKIDTINQETGELNADSALSLIVYGETNEHLDLLDGLLEELLQAKWKAFGKRTWISSFTAFTFYYITFFSAFMCRPFSKTTYVITKGQIDVFGNCRTDVVVNNTDWLLKDEARAAPPSLFAHYANNYYFETATCHLWDYSQSGSGPIHQGKMRLVCESLVLLMVFIQLIIEIRDVYNIGKKRWWQVLKSFPAKILYKISLLLTLSILPIRLMCGINETLLLLDNMFSLLAVIMTTIHFLFYCRAVKFVGPFVLMVYTIITRDMIRFFLIYFIFLMGFSQGFYLIFLACERQNAKDVNDTLHSENGIMPHANILANPVESMVRLFITTIGEFTVFYRELNGCSAKEMATLGKVLFVIFEMFVSLMQFNLLIAMMTRTYELIYRTQKEWKRQWAQVILMLELSLQPKDRLMALLKYSRPIGTDKRRRAFVVSRKIDTFTETERMLKEQQENEKIKEKKLLLKRRLRDFHKDGPKVQAGTLRPTTSAAYLAPTPAHK
ncbi:Transient receptor potential cation channel subfamily V member 6 [Aphelenchoides fujianensis]|nr:Transient receptor potential cation channel subfamily V member 6 [Aphelenchoides fujianensis]